MIALALRLLRLGGRRAWTSAGLVGAGVAVATTLLAISVGALHGLDERESRTGWRTPAEAATGTDPVALLRLRTDFAAGRPITQVDLVAPVAGATPPPGLPRMPAPGEVWVSPALAELMGTLPAGDLAARYPGPATGLVGDAGLQSPDELVAVIGRPAGDPVLLAKGGSDVVPVAAFDRTGDGVSTADLYRQLTIVAVALVVFPVAGLLGASARLSAARRSERLATLRLLGASTRQVTVVAVAEVTAVATVAAVVGVVLEAVLSPLVALIPLAGSGWFAADVRPGFLPCLAIVVGVALLATASAVGGLRQVVVGPRGVARRQRPQGARGLRLLGVAAALVVLLVVNSALPVVSVDAAGVVFVLVILAMVGAVALIGPLVVRVVGTRMAARARSVPGLLAGRRLLDDPKGAFRPLAGLTLAVFVAGFLAPMTAAVAGVSSVDATTLQVTAPPSEVAGLVQTTRARLAAIGLPATVSTVGDTVAVLPRDPAGLDRARTVLDGLAPGSVAQTEAEARHEDTVLTADLGRGALVVLVATFLVAATATGTAAAARVLDHRHTLRLLTLAGTPLAVLDRARRAETVRPLLVNGAIALVLGLFCASPFVAATAALRPSGLLTLGGVLVAGTALVLAATAASRPLLRSVTAPDQERSR
ncbi:MAG: hypothetical protein OJJ54_04600 [Pseudonocardia sp.]|nr:hypothetical protein [Pseudonocardia sp.]